MKRKFYMNFLILIKYWNCCEFKIYKWVIMKNCNRLHGSVYIFSINYTAHHDAFEKRWTAWAKYLCLDIQSATWNPRQPRFCPIRFEFDDVRSIFRQHMFFKIRLERASTLKRKARSGLNLMSVLLLRNV